MSEIIGTIDNFDTEVLKSPVPVVVDIWATWCGPCKVIGPILSALEQQYGGKFKLVKVDADDNPELVERYNVMSIPTMKFFKNGQEISELIGAAPQHIIEERIKQIVG